MTKIKDQGLADREAFYKAIEHDDLHTVKNFVEQDILNQNLKKFKYFSPLGHAIFHSSINVAQFLIDSGQNLILSSNELGECLNSNLEIAILKNSHKAVALLLDNSQDIESQWNWFSILLIFTSYNLNKNKNINITIGQSLCDCMILFSNGDAIFREAIYSAAASAVPDALDLFIQNAVRLKPPTNFIDPRFTESDFLTDYLFQFEESALDHNGLKCAQILYENDFIELKNAFVEKTFATAWSKSDKAKIMLFFAYAGLYLENSVDEPYNVWASALYQTLEDNCEFESYHDFTDTFDRLKENRINAERQKLQPAAKSSLPAP